MANTELIGATQIVSIMSHGSTRQGLIRRKLSMTSADAQLFGQFRFSHVAVGRHADDYEGTASPGLVNRLKGAKWMGMAELESLFNRISPSLLCYSFILPLHTE